MPDIIESAAAYPNRPLSRRHLLGRGVVALLGSQALSGCGSSGEAQSALATFKPLVGLAPNQAYTAADVEKRPYSSIGVHFGIEPDALIVLAQVDPDRRLVWLSADNRMIITRGGRVMRFSGGGTDAVIEMPSGTDPLFAGLQGQSGPLRTRWKISYPKRNIFELDAVGELSIAGPDKFKGLYKEIPVTHWVEKVRVAQADWSFQNEYWLADDGRIWRSRQYLAPDIPPIEIKLLRPAE